MDRRPRHSARRLAAGLGLVPRRDQPHGQILVLFAFVLVALLAVSALAVDYGGWLLARRSYQNGADAAALAGAAQLTSPITDVCSGGGTKNYCAREAAYESLKASLHLPASFSSAGAALGPDFTIPIVSNGYSMWVASPPSDAGAKYPGAVSTQRTIFVWVEKVQSANLSRIVLPAGQTVSAWATAGRIPQNFAFVGLCYQSHSRIGSDCHTGSGEDVSINGAGSAVVIEQGDVGVNTWVKTSNNAELALGSDSGAYMGNFNQCWSNPNQCTLVGWPNPPGGTRSAIPLGPQIQDPGYPEPPVSSTTMPWQCGGSGGIAFAPGIDSGATTAVAAPPMVLAAAVGPLPSAGIGLAAPSTIIAGTVTDANNGAGIAGATVTITGPGGPYSLLSGATGAYSQKVLGAGTYSATATKAGYGAPSSNPASVAVVAGATGTINITLSPNGGTITGTVKNTGGTLIVGATVTIQGGASATTNALGIYTFSNVPSGTPSKSYSLTASAAGYTTSLPQTANVTPGGTVNLPFVLGAVGSVTGKITDSVSGLPLAGATVSIAGQASTTSAADGTYTLGGITAGTYTVSASLAGYITNTASNVKVVAGATTANVNIALTPTGGTLQGTVTDQITSSPIAGAVVTAVGYGSTTTNAAGFYKFAGIPAARYDMTVTSLGYFDGVANNVQVNAGLTTTQNFQLGPSTCERNNNGSYTKGNWANCQPGTSDPCAAPFSPTGAALDQAGDISCNRNDGTNRIRPGTYNNITIPSNACAFIDPSPAGGLAAGQTPGVVHIQGTLSIGSNAFLFGDGVTIVLDQNANVTIGNSGGFVLNYGTKYVSGGSPACDLTTSWAQGDPKCFRRVPDGSHYDGKDYTYAAWMVDIKSRVGTSPWTSCSATNYNLSCLSAAQLGRTLGITWYLRGSSGNAHRFYFDGLMGFLFNGILYAPQDNIKIGGQGAQGSAGQIVGWTITYSGATNIFHRYAGIQTDGPPYLIEPFLGQ